MTTDVRQVAIGIPTYDGNVSMPTMTCLLRDTLALLPHKIVLSIIASSNGTYISHSRNEIVDRFLQNKEINDLIFIDSDMEWESGALLKLLSFDTDIVGGAYRRKNDKIEDYCVSFLDQDELWADAQGLIPVAGLPTGFMRIRRKVFSRLIKDLLVAPYREQGGLRLINNFFYQQHIGSDFFGEDYMFCKLARDSGYKIMLAPEMQINHIGRQSYNGHVGNWLRSKLSTKENGNGQ